MRKIWVDTTSGTWGEVVSNNGALMIVDLATLVDTESEVQPLLDSMDTWSDGEVADFALRNGRVADSAAAQVKADLILAEHRIVALERRVNEQHREA